MEQKERLKKIVEWCKYREFLLFELLTSLKTNIASVEEAGLVGHNMTLSEIQNLQEEIATLKSTIAAIKCLSNIVEQEEDEIWVHGRPSPDMMANATLANICETWENIYGEK